MKKFSLLLASLVVLASNSFAEIVKQESGQKIWDYEITAKKLDNSRNKLSPKTGGSSFLFSQEDLNSLPQGQATTLNQVLLRAPGVTQNSNGQIHIRGDHSAVQYRINGIMLPRGVTGFGQSFDTYFADSVELLTGALPAQYGYKTAGVVEIKTKSGIFNKGGRAEATIGDNRTRGLNQQVGGSEGNLNYFLSASYLQNDRGIESATRERKNHHNDTKQDRVFGYFSRLLDDSSRLSLILGNGTSRFQIPNTPGRRPSYTLTGQNSVDSSSLNQNQQESSRYGILAWQGVSDYGIDYQLSYFARYSEMKYRSDYVGDLMFNGIASDVDRSSLINGVQGDFSYALNDKNTLRSGFFFSDEANKKETRNAVFPGASDAQTSSNPRTIRDDTKRSSQLYGIYLQDELKATEKLTLNFGGRFDISHAMTHEGQFQPRAGMVYDLNDKTKFHAGYARYFTVPQTERLQNSTLEKFAGTTNDKGIGGGKVKSERTDYYDIGLSRKIVKGFTIGLDAYLKRIRNMLDEGQFGNAQIYTPFNFYQGRSHGIELTADYRSGNFSSYANFAAQKTKVKGVASGRNLVESDEALYLDGRYGHADHDQSYSASAGLAYSFGKISYALDGIYGNGLRHGFAASNRLKSYTQVNSSIARDFDFLMVNKLNLRLSALNVFDEVYQLSDGSGIGIASTRYGPRRTFYLIASKVF